MSAPSKAFPAAVAVLLATLAVAGGPGGPLGVGAQEDDATPDAWPNLALTPDRRSSFGQTGGGTGQAIWDHQVPQRISRSSPAVVGDAVYIGSRSGVHAVDRVTGEEIWRANVSAVGGHVHSSPAVVDGTVYVGTWLFGGNLTALDAGTGEVLWSTRLDSRIFSSPAVADGRVFVGTSHGGRAEDHSGSFVALDAETGGVVWSHQTDHVVRSSPVVVDGVVYVGSSEGRVYAYDAATGGFAWPTAFFRTEGHVESSPAVVDGRLYITSCTGPCDERRNATLFALDADTGQQIWKRDLFAPQRGSIAVHDDVLYFGDEGGIVWAVRDAGDESEIVWRNTTINSILSGPAYANDTVYVTALDHHVHALDADTGQPRWQFTDEKRGNPIYSTPAVVDGRLYFFMRDRLYALDAGAGVPVPDEGGGDGDDPLDLGIPVPGPGVAMAVAAALVAAAARRRR